MRSVDLNRFVFQHVFMGSGFQLVLLYSFFKVLDYFVCVQFIHVSILSPMLFFFFLNTVRPKTDASRAGRILN